LDKENPNWPGNYKVKYWHSDWQNIILDYTRRIGEAGLDGAYLDIIDAFAYYESK
jgi:cysteinyl-tRNA synthetase, unknown class